MPAEASSLSARPPAVTASAILAARARQSPELVHTPLLESPLLNRLSGRRILVKAECLQVTGSFKARGAWAAVSALPPGTRGVLAMSSGNHAQGVAWASARHAIAAVILMPADAPAVKIANTRALGAEVVLYDRMTTDRDQLAAEIATRRGLALIPPYDHPEVMAGQGTIGLELGEDLAARAITSGAVITPCGGGGLASGLATGLAHAAPGLRLATAEPEGFDDMARSLSSGTRVRNPSPGGSICDAILTPTPGQLTFPVLQALAAPGHVVSDDQALHAMALAFRHLRIVLEPGGAVALAAALFAPDLPEVVVVIGSGGNVDPALFNRALAHYVESDPPHHARP